MKVKYNGKVSNFCEDPRKYDCLIKGQIYKVTYLNQGSSFTNYRLESVSGTFNSTCFDLVGKYHAIAYKVPTVGESFRCRVLLSLNLGHGYMRYDTSTVEAINEVERGKIYEVYTKDCFFLLHVRKK